MSNQGWIKLHRKLKEKGWYNRSEYVHLWIHLLMEANHKGKEFFFAGENIVLKPGQMVTGRKSLSAVTGISESKVQRILKCFENEQQIEQQTTNKFRLISLPNWKEYQLSEQQSEQQMNNKRTTSEQQVNTNKNDNNKKNEKNKPVKTIKKSFGEFDNVNLSEEEHRKLTEKFGPPKTDDLIQRLSGYMSSKGKTYKNHYATMLGFARKDGATTVAATNSGTKCSGHGMYACTLC